MRSRKQSFRAKSSILKRIYDKIKQNGKDKVLAAACEGTHTLP